MYFSLIACIKPMQNFRYALLDGFLTITSEKVINQNFYFKYFNKDKIQ